MIQLKACARCGGDMMGEEILGELELVCLQCGHRSYPQAATPVQTPEPRRRLPAAA